MGRIGGRMEEKKRWTGAREEGTFSKMWETDDPLSLLPSLSFQYYTSSLFSVLGTMTPRDSFFVPLKLHHLPRPLEPVDIYRAMEKVCQLIVKRRGGTIYARNLTRRPNDVSMFLGNFR